MPKNLTLFYAAIITSIVALWLFAFTLYWLGRESDIIGANIGAGMLGLLSWLLGMVSAVLLILAYCIKPKKP